MSGVKMGGMRLVLGAAIALGLMATPAAAQASGRTGYGQQARVVAHEVNCRHVRAARGAGDFDLSSVICDARGHRVNVLTFASYRQERDWLTAVNAAYPGGGWVAYTVGIAVVAKNGNRAAALEGKRMLGRSSHLMRASL